MKKIRLLTPIIGFGIVATSGISVASCSATKFSVDVPFTYSGETDHTAIRSKEKISTPAKNIEINIETKLLSDKNNDRVPTCAVFLITNTIEGDVEKDLYNFDDATVYAEGKELEKVDTFEEFTGANQYTFYPPGEKRENIYFSEGTLDNWPKLTISLRLKDPIENNYLVFYLQ